MSLPEQTDSMFDMVFEDIPDYFSLKQKLSETTACEVWDAFDRSKKKKTVLSRIKKDFCADDSCFERFKNELLAWNDHRQIATDWPIVVALGKDSEGLWYFHEPVQGKPLSETVDSGKKLKPYEVAKRFAALAEILVRAHQAGLFHRNLKPGNLFFTGNEVATLIDPDVGHFRDPSVWGERYEPTLFGDVEFLAPEQRTSGTGTVIDAKADIWSFGACLAYALCGKLPAQLQESDLPAPFASLIAAAMKDLPMERPSTMSDISGMLERIIRETRPSTFESSESVAPSPQPVSAAAIPQPSTTASVPSPDPGLTAPPLPPETVCPQCHTPVRSATDRICHQCGRPFYEPCLNCQSTNPFWIRSCRGCRADLPALKQKMLATLNNHKQQILKLRETYGHDKTLPLLKYMATINHPDFIAFREWAKSMTALIHKERREIRAYVDNIRIQANEAMAAQKYERVQQILEQIPRPLLDEGFRKQYVEAGEILTEVDSLIREIRNAIATKQYSQLLSCVQRYSELKANDPEAKSLQQKIEKLTTTISAKGMKLRRIPTGRFYMGSHDTDEFLRNNEHPQHRVLITKSLFVGVYPVTQREFAEIMEFNPSVSTEMETCPVDSVSWFSALEFCNKMSDLEELSHYYELTKIKRRSNGLIESADVKTLGGDGYRLPTEAEWEYVCRAGSITPWCFGDQVMEVGEYAWYFDNSSMETHPIGEKKPNSWGLFDMHGNIMEWCHDWYGEFFYQQCPDEEENPRGPDDGLGKVLRGGAWQFGAEATRSAYRNSSAPDTSSSVIGFRVCRNAGEAMM